jgi:hypothetical protein
MQPKAARPLPNLKRTFANQGRATACGRPLPEPADLNRRRAGLSRIMAFIHGQASARLGARSSREVVMHLAGTILPIFAIILAG